MVALLVSVTIHVDVELLRAVRLSRRVETPVLLEKFHLRCSQRLLRRVFIFLDLEVVTKAFLLLFEDFMAALLWKWLISLPVHTIQVFSCPGRGTRKPFTRWWFEQRFTVISIKLEIRLQISLRNLFIRLLSRIRPLHELRNISIHVDRTPFLPNSFHLRFSQNKLLFFFRVIPYLPRWNIHFFIFCFRKRLRFYGCFLFSRPLNQKDQRIVILRKLGHFRWRILVFVEWYLLLWFLPLCLPCSGPLSIQLFLLFLLDHHFLLHLD